MPMDASQAIMIIALELQFTDDIWIEHYLLPLISHFCLLFCFADMCSNRIPLVLAALPATNHGVQLSSAKVRLLK